MKNGRATVKGTTSTGLGPELEAEQSAPGVGTISIENSTIPVVVPTGVTAI